MTRLLEKDWESFIDFLKEETEKIYFILYLVDFCPYSEDEIKDNPITNFILKYQDLAKKSAILTEEILNREEGENPMHSQNKFIEDKITEFYTRYEYQKDFLEEHPELVKDLESFGYNEKIKEEYKDLLEFFNVKIES